MTPGAPWLRERDESRWRALALAPLVPVAWMYAMGAGLHRAAYRCGGLPRARLPIRVISVGNLVVGGTAKTPTAAWIAASLHARGHKVALASRGYRRARGAPDDDAVLPVSDGRRVLSRAECAGDEPMVLAAHAPGVPVLVGSDRVRVGLRAFSAFGCEVLVLDDGFQHHRLHRDVDVVMVDGAFGFGNGRVLPRGPLREPAAALRFADAIGVVDGPLPPRDAEAIAQRAPDARRFAARRTPRGLRNLRGGASREPGELDGAEVGMLAGLANPATLRRTLERLGAKVVGERCFSDHHHYRPRDLRGLAAQAPRWITTEKDALKITPEWVRGADVEVLRIDLDVDDPAAFVDWLDARVR